MFLNDAITHLRSGEAYFRDLDTQTQVAFMDQVRDEHEANLHAPLSGEATQALIVSARGFVALGVKKFKSYADIERRYTLTTMRSRTL